LLTPTLVWANFAPQGDREQVQEHLTTAMAMYLEMGMTYWLDQVEAERRQLG